LDLAKYGWYIDLPADTGERVVSDAVARGDLIFFNTVIPTEDPCEYGGSGWEMSVRIENGGSPMTPIVDQNLDGVVNNNDKIQVLLDGGSGPTTFVPSGRKVEDDEGLPSGPAIVGDKLFTRGSNEDEPPKKGTALAPATGLVGRLSWEQLFRSQ
jgi:type IV pilus assembly protein PilY1